MRLEGKAAIITGAASGIGRAMARRFAAEGALLSLVDIQEPRLKKVAGELTDAGFSVHPVVADLSDRAAVEDAVERAVSVFGRLDVLCNNAGMLDNLTPLTETEDDLWDRVMNVNLRAPFVAARVAIPHMLASGGGSIINTSSAAGMCGGRGGAAYTTSKHGVVGLTRSVAWFYGPKGIRCNALAPGAIATAMQRMVPHPEGFERMQSYFSTVPPHGKSADVADAALFLASDESRYVNGTVLRVDGGWTAY